MGKDGAVQQRLYLLMKIIVAGFVMSLLAGVLSLQLISWKMRESINALAMQQQPEHESTSHLGASFFYHRIGHSQGSVQAGFSYIPALPSLSSFLPTGQGDGATAALEGSGKYTIKVRHVTQKQAAEQMIDELNVAGLPAFMSPLQGGYRVSMGLFFDEQEAQDALQTLATRTAYRGEVLRLDAGP